MIDSELINWAMNNSIAVLFAILFYLDFRKILLKQTQTITMLEKTISKICN